MKIYGKHIKSGITYEFRDNVKGKKKSSELSVGTR